MATVAMTVLVGAGGCSPCSRGYPQSIGVGGDVSGTKGAAGRVRIQADLAAWIDDTDGCRDLSTCQARVRVDVIVDGVRRLESFAWDIGTDAPRAEISRSVESTVSLEPGNHCVLVSLAQDGQQVIDHGRQGTSAILSTDVTVEGADAIDHCRYRTQQPADDLPVVDPVVACRPVLSDVPNGTHVRRLIEPGDPVYASVGGCEGSVEGAVLVRDGRMVLAQNGEPLHIGYVTPVDLGTEDQWLQVLVFGAEEGRTGPPSSNPVHVDR